MRKLTQASIFQHSLIICPQWCSPREDILIDADDRQIRTFENRTVNDEALPSLRCFRILRFFITGAKINCPAALRWDNLTFTTCHKPYHSSLGQPEITIQQLWN